MAGQRAKIWKMNIDSVPAMAVTGNAAFMIGAENRFVKVNESGTTVYGPMSVVAGTETIKTGGMFVSLPNLVKMVPSTFVSPLPDQLPFPPINVGFDLAEDAAFFAILLA